MADTPTRGQKLAAEALGTFVLVLLGVGAALMSGGDYVATGLAFGLAVLVMMASVGPVSGGHFNPAVTLGAALTRRLAWRDAASYWLAQAVGGVGGGLVLWVLMHGFAGFDSPDGFVAFDSRRDFGQNAFGAESSGGYAWWAAMLLEIVMTAVFVGVFLAMTDRRRGHTALAPVVIGLALAVVHFASMGATGTSVNPARSLGANLFAGPDAIGQLWLFLLAPMIGGAACGILYPALFGRDSGAADVTGVEPAAAPGGASEEPGSVQPWSEDPPTDPGPPREWGEPAPPASAPQWRPPAGIAGGSPASASDKSDDVLATNTDTAMPWPDEGFPMPKEPYWSQQLPPHWDESPDDGDDRTQIRPSDDR